MEEFDRASAKINMFWKPKKTIEHQIKIHLYTKAAVSKENRFINNKLSIAFKIPNSIEINKEENQHIMVTGISMEDCKEFYNQWLKDNGYE